MVYALFYLKMKRIFFISLMFISASIKVFAQFGMFGGYGGNMNYLLDPRYAMMQVMAQQQYYNQVFNNSVNSTYNQVMAQEDAEYQEFARNVKKPDGSTYTKDEWRAMQGQALQEMKSGNVNSNRSRSEEYSGSTSHKCAYCNNTGQIIIEQSVETYGQNNSKYCNICDKMTLTGYTHYHRSCKCGRARTSGNFRSYNRIPW